MYFTKFYCLIEIIYQIKSIEYKREQSINNNKGQKSKKKTMEIKRKVTKNKKCPEKFRIYYQNVRELKSKIRLTTGNDRWLPTKFSTYSKTHMQKPQGIQIPGYSLMYHNDRSANNGKILTMVRDNLKNINLD